MKRKFYIAAAAMCMLLSACGEVSGSEGSGTVSDMPAAVSQTAAENESVSETSAVIEPDDITEEITDDITEKAAAEDIADDVLQEDIIEDIIDEELPPYENGAVEVDEFFGNYDWEAQNIANEKYARLMDSFPGDIEPEKEYPENYCGAYYEDSSLYICLTDISEEAVKPYRDITGDDRVEFIQQEFPLSYIRENQEYISGLMSDREWEINSTGVYQRDNRLGIGVGSREAEERLRVHLLEKGYPENSFLIEIEAMAVPC